MDNKKKLKAQLTNEIAKKYSNRIKELEDSRNALRTKIEIERVQFLEFQSKYLDLVQKVEQLEDWNNRLMEYFQLDEDSQKKYLEELKSKENLAESLERLLTKIYNYSFNVY